jgi:hypothetical protein
MMKRKMQYIIKKQKTKALTSLGLLFFCCKVFENEYVYGNVYISSCPGIFIVQLDFPFEELHMDCFGHVFDELIKLFSTEFIMNGVVSVKAFRSNKIVPRAFGEDDQRTV